MGLNYRCGHGIVMGLDVVNRILCIVEGCD